MDDTISRRQAIDAVDSETVSTNPDHFQSSEKFIKFMDDADIASFGKWQWANGFNTALVASKIRLKKLPSAQPYTEEQIQKMQDLEQAQIQTAYEIGKAERKTGRWIYDPEPYPMGGAFGHYECDQCGEWIRGTETNFCPNCGCKMEVEHE